MYNDIEFAIIAIRRIISGLQLHPWHIFEHNLVSKIRFSSNLGLLLITGMIFFINYLTDFSCFDQDSQNRLKINDHFERGCRWFQLFLIDCQLFSN